MKPLLRIDTDRNNWTFRFAKVVNIWGYKHLGKPHVEMPPGLKELRKQGNIFLYTGLHKSLWETTGILVVLYLNKLPLPYTGMGDNLVHGKFFQTLAKKTGVFLVKRATNSREMLESAKQLKDFIVSYIAHGMDVILFPEGTRKSIINTGEYGKFYSTAFEAVLEYEKEKTTILQENPGLMSHDTYIIPVNVDYSIIREDWEMIHTFQGKPRTLHIFDSLKMIKKVGDTYISFGEPIKTSEYMNMNRKDMAVFVRSKCLELVKVLPINIVSRAILDSVENGVINKSVIEKNIAVNIEKLLHVKERFRGFSVGEAPVEILQRVARMVSCYREEHLDIKNYQFYKFYADFISHYLKV